MYKRTEMNALINNVHEPLLAYLNLHELPVQIPISIPLSGFAYGPGLWKGLAFHGWKMSCIHTALTKPDGTQLYDLHSISKTSSVSLGE